jgi:hypothetical protein
VKAAQTGSEDRAPIPTCHVRADVTMRRWAAHEQGVALRDSTDQAQDQRRARHAAGEPEGSVALATEGSGRSPHSCIQPCTAMNRDACIGVGRGRASSGAIAASAARLPATACRGSPLRGATAPGYGARSCSSTASTHADPPGTRTEAARGNGASSRHFSAILTIVLSADRKRLASTR